MKKHWIIFNDNGTIVGVESAVTKTEAIFAHAISHYNGTAFPLDVFDAEPDEPIDYKFSIEGFKITLTIDPSIIMFN